MNEDLIKQDLQEIAGRLRDRLLSVMELHELAVARHELYGPALNAYESWAPEQARQTALEADRAFAAGRYYGPLQGIPVSVKDLFGVQGLPTWAGTARQLPNEWTREGSMVTALRQHRAPIMGKTHTVELAFGGIGVNTHRGTPRNPWDAESHRVPGGSSSGAGVSLCEGSAWLALGTDTAGSVRIPATMTGNVGLKTSAGRWPCDGIVPLSPTLDSVGLLARSVADASFAFACLDPTTRGPLTMQDRVAGIELRDLRVGIGEPALWNHCEPAIVAAVESALEDLETRGTRLVQQPLPTVVEAMELLQVGSVVSAECDEFLESRLPAWRDTISPHLRLRIEDGAAISAREYLHRRRRLSELAQRSQQYFNEVDVIVAPTVPISPPAVSDVEQLDVYRRANMAVLGNTCVANYLNLCALTMPVGLDFLGLPVGMQLLAPHGTDTQLLAIATAIETAIGKPRERIGSPPL